MHKLIARASGWGCLFAILMGGGSAYAASYYWDAGADYLVTNVTSTTRVFVTEWPNPTNWSANTKPTAADQARFGNEARWADWVTLTVTLNETETVDNVWVDATHCNYDWLGSGRANVAGDFFYKTTWVNNYFQPVLKLGGKFYTDATYQDGRGRLKFGDAGGYTSGNVFGGGIYNYTKKLDLGGSTTFSNTLLVQGTAVNGWYEYSGHYVGITKISGTPTFGPGLTFDLRRGGTLWFPGAADFSNVSAPLFNGGTLRLDATSGSICPTYVNGFEVKRGILGIVGNGSLGGTDANGIILGGAGTFGHLMGGADNSAGNYITRPITLAGNGGVVDLTQVFANSDMNFATAVTGSGALIKTGNKALYLRNAGNGTTSSYSGGTVVANGDLVVESARSLGTGNVEIRSGGRLFLSAAGNVDSEAKVLIGGAWNNPGMLVLQANITPPTIDINSTGTIALDSINLRSSFTAIGSAFLGSYNNGARYSGVSLPAGGGNTYRIGGVLGATGGGGWQNMLNLDVNGADNGTGVLTGPNDVLVAYGGAWLRDINDFTGTLTVRHNFSYGGWSGAWLQPEFQTGGSPLGSTTGAVNLEDGLIYFLNANNGQAITKGALNVQGQDAIFVDSAGSQNNSTVTFASLNRINRGQLIINGAQTGYPLGLLGGKEKFVVTAAPGVVNGMVDPWLTAAWGANGTFLTYGATGFTQALYTLTVPAGGFPTGKNNGTNVVQVTGAATLGDNPDIYALRADAAISQGAGTLITNRSGGLILNSADTHNVNWKFGAAGGAEAILFATSDTTLSGTLTTTGGLTKGGPGIVRLNADNSATLSGKIVVNGGYLYLYATTDSKALGNANNVVCLNGGGFGGLTNNHTISVGPVGGYLTYWGGTINGPIVDDVPGQAGPLVITAPQSFRGTNSSTGGVVVEPGMSMRIDQRGTPGLGPVTIKTGAYLVQFGYGWTNLSRFSLQGGNVFAALVLSSELVSGAQTWRLGSVEGSGNISFGNDYNPPQAGSGIVVGGDNTSCDYYGSISEYGPGTSYFVTKEGTGTWTLWGDHTYHGATTVSNGTLLVNGSLEFTAGVLATGFGSKLGGKGTISAPVTVNGGATLAPGASPGTLTVDNLAMWDSYLEIEIASNVVSGLYDKLVVNRTVKLDPTSFTGTLLQLKLPGYYPNDQQWYTILENDGTDLIDGGFWNATQDLDNPDFFWVMDETSTFTFYLTYTGGDGNDIQIQSLIPEPATAGLLLLGGLAMLRLKMRRLRP